MESDVDVLELEPELEAGTPVSTVWKVRADRPPLGPLVAVVVLGAVLLGVADWLGERHGHQRRV